MTLQETPLEVKSFIRLETPVIAMTDSSPIKIVCFIFQNDFQYGTAQSQHVNVYKQMRIDVIR